MKQIKPQEVIDWLKEQPKDRTLEFHNNPDFESFCLFTCYAREKLKLCDPICLSRGEIIEGRYQLGAQTVATVPFHNSFWRLDGNVIAHQNPVTPAEAIERLEELL